MPHPLRLLLAAAAAIVLLAGCAAPNSPQNTVFDFGPASPAGAPRLAAGSAPLAALVVTDATGSSALDSERMFYRLQYADPLQARSYANSRWSASPLQLVTQRLRIRLAQSGSKVLAPTDASNGVPILRLEVDEFVHAFSSATASDGQLVLRASLFQGHRLIDQRSFTQQRPASSASAAGGARALADSTDAVAADLAAWLASLNLDGR